MRFLRNEYILQNEKGDKNTFAKTEFVRSRVARCGLSVNDDAMKTCIRNEQTMIPSQFGEILYLNVGQI